MRTLSSLCSAMALACVVVACSQTDAGISTSVKTKLAANDLVKAHQIDVDTTNHVVTLTGDVDTLVAKEEALRVARTTEGVRDVVDHVNVKDITATSGDVDNAIEKGADATVDGIKKGAEATKDGVEKAAKATEKGAKKVGRTIRDAVTDDDHDSNKDGR